MQLGSILAIYFLVWVFAAFVTLPFGVKTDDEVGAEKVPGQAESAPHHFDPRRHMFRAALIAIPLTALWIANYEFDWINAEMFAFF